MGQKLHIDNNYLIFIGALIFWFCVFVIFKRKNRAAGIIFVGLSLLFFNILLNVFALSDYWNQDLGALNGLPIYRHIIVGFYGVILVASGISVFLNEDGLPIKSRLFNSNFAAFFYAAWFIGVGWFAVAGFITREPLSPTLNNSQWQAMAQAIDFGGSSLCVPINPATWVYQRDCTFLNPVPAWDNGSVLIVNPLSAELKPSASISDKSIISAALLVKPFSVKKSFIAIQMVIKLTDGGIKYFSGSREVEPSGALLLVTGKGSIPVKNISSIRLIFNMPVEIAMAKKDDMARLPGIVWMGN